MDLNDIFASLGELSRDDLEELGIRVHNEIAKRIDEVPYKPMKTILGNNTDDRTTWELQE